MKRKDKDVLIQHGNHAKIDQTGPSDSLYVTNMLTQYTVPREGLPDELDDAHTEAAKLRVDENEK